MEIHRVQGLSWQLAGVHYVRIAASNPAPLSAPLPLEFADDQADSRYILVMEGDQPVATCRLRQLDQETGQIERVATVPWQEGRGYGRAGVQAAEAWLTESGCQRFLINSRTAVQAFYEKQGYQAISQEVTGQPPFDCILLAKSLKTSKGDDIND
ncbi:MULTISPECIES: GNAT family N-acetyltransferase [Aerococcus]|uniref:GNAT family N-acetyltransferase n=1 Tax=Aerococcus sanguinicola TaxID=119206 RepID=A0A5N1GID9_9LACT|nr:MULTISPECIES: GNAT family N-acetyltransferase [Aerococcus]KAA9300174.1 GNAT family N-acetyltransferase [Aerococcus sanguinicola]MDK6369516.1 GNAT family N-acetyltransferase [Aerococcus sp. UMB9870]MDK6680003.1 GNAT family N-acetyltransferase [Aerococcus sp. UMB8608]MDK6686115.1 GNAT family N-acetyltransferase [Aerococcus sp. UMB8623]MDK6939895.1 GNAT family N-acetyltransferase [Aerococcus sp. UMB8487]